MVGPPPGLRGVPEAFSAVQTTLAELLRQGGAKSFRYHYDFGDDWVHTVKVEAVTDADPDSAYPRLLEARRACPPEDCGGPWGYSGCLAAIADPAHERHAEMRDWLGEGFDSGAVDEAAIRKSLKALALPGLGARRAPPPGEPVDLPAAVTRGVQCSVPLTQHCTVHPASFLLHALAAQPSIEFCFQARCGAAKAFLQLANGGLLALGEIERSPTDTERLSLLQEEPRVRDRRPNVVARFSWADADGASLRSGTAGSTPPMAKAIAIVPASIASDFAGGNS